MKGAKGAAKMENTTQHPAHVFYLVTLILLGIMVLFGFISVFVPWVMKDIGVGKRAWAYPFKTCIQDTFSKVHAESCLDNDFIVPEGVPLTGGNAQCKAFVLATIAFVFISVIGGVITLLMLTVIILSLWTRPFVLGAVAQFWLILVCIAAFLSWIMFICYAETTCAPNSIFPVSGYSYGFILYIFASASSWAAVFTGFMGLAKLSSFRPLSDSHNDEDELLPAFQRRSMEDPQLPPLYGPPNQMMYSNQSQAMYQSQSPSGNRSQIISPTSQSGKRYPTQSPAAHPDQTPITYPTYGGPEQDAPPNDSFYSRALFW